MDALPPLRKKIDAIDDQVLRLLNERANLALEVARVKNDHNAPLHVPERERAILARLAKENPGPFPTIALMAVFRDIISTCLNLEGPIRIAYMGPQATYSHQAAHRYFGAGCTFVAKASVPDVLTTIQKGEADYGVVPVENSAEGSIAVTLDLVGASELSVCGETVLPIHHCLLAKDTPIEKITRVYSHPQPVAQCRTWLATSLPGVEVCELASTAVAAGEAAKNPGSAAIASRMAAETYGLSVLAENIEDTATNRTRFWVVAAGDRAPKDANKTSLLVSIKDQAGSLHSMLAPFDKHKVGLTRIESRPSRQQPWEYLFFIDFLGIPEDANVKKALAAVESGSQWVKVLGTYAQADEARGKYKA